MLLSKAYQTPDLPASDPMCEGFLVDKLKNIIQYLLLRYIYYTMFFLF